MTDLLEGTEVDIRWSGLDLSGTVEHIYEDGGCRVKCGPALWVYLPARSTVDLVPKESA